MELVGTNTTNASGRVSAEKENLVGEAPDGTGNVLLGRFAFWVGDEGVKARANLHDPFFGESEEVILGGNQPSANRFFRHQGPQRSGLKGLSGFDGIELNDQSGHMEKVLAPRQFRYLNGVGSITPIKDNFHVITPCSSGVIADTLNGGLKIDLTPYFHHGDAVQPGLDATALPGGGGVTFGQLRAWWKDGLGLSGFADPSLASVAPRLPPGIPADGAAILPIMVRASVFVGTTSAGPSAGEKELTLHLVPVLAIWNPYTVSLQAVDYRVEMNWQATFTFTVNGTLVPGSYTLPPTLSFLIPSLGFAPGECRIISVSDEETDGGFAPYDLAGQNLLKPKWFGANAFFFELAPPVTFTDAGINRVVMHENPADVFGETRLYLGATSAEPIQVVDGSNWGYVPQLNRPGSSPSDPPVPEIQDTTSTPPVFVIYRGMVEHGARLWPANWDDWHGIDHETADMKNLDGTPLGFTPAPNEEPIEDIQVQFGVDEIDPTYHFAYTGLSWNQPVENGNPVFGQRYNAFFDIPREDVPVLSVGRLQQVMTTIPSWETAESRSFLVKRLFDEVPGLESALWDEFYFSGVPDQRIPSGGEPAVPSTARAPVLAENIGNPEYRMPNSRMRFYKPGGVIPQVDDVRFTRANNPMQTAAAHLLIHGAFNINSVSVNAWTTVLNSFMGVQVDTAYAGQTSEDGSVMSRFSHPPVGPFQVPANSGSFPVLSDSNSGRSFPKFAGQAGVWAGGRRLTAGEAGSLASQIVSRIESHGVFASLAEFVSANIIASAIAATPLNADIRPTQPPEGNPSEEVILPGMITQRDVLQSLGSILTPRSDTFIVRAYGETINPVTARVEGRAWCEAIVQRTPDYLLPPALGGDEAWLPPSQPRNVAFGRRFQVVSFRWLTPADV